MAAEEQVLEADGTNEPTYVIVEDGKLSGLKTHRMNGIQLQWRLEKIIELLNDGMRFRHMKKVEGTKQ